jgi:hypothetical protein
MLTLSPLCSSCRGLVFTLSPIGGQTGPSTALLINRLGGPEQPTAGEHADERPRSRVSGEAPPRRGHRGAERGEGVGQVGALRLEVSLMSLADLNGDGKTDLLALDIDSTLHWYPGEGDGTFWSARDLDNAGFKLMWLADLNGDGKADLLAVYNDLTMHWYPGKGDGTFWSARDLGNANFMLMTLQSHIDAKPRRQIVEFDSMVDLTVVWRRNDRQRLWVERRPSMARSARRPNGVA